MFNHLLSLSLLAFLITTSACKHEVTDSQINSFEKSYGDISEDSGNDIIVSDRNVFLLGSTSTTSGNRIYLVKTDIDGNEIWNRKFGGESNASGSSMLLEESGNLTICGTSNNRL
ncbi:MAG: outer membrane protein assembly factor BamB, partial [Bacteroidia bacterium]